MWKGAPARVDVAWCARGLGFRQNWSRVRTKNEGGLGLKQGNVAMFGATLQRSRADICQRRDVPEKEVFQRRDVPENVKNQRRDVGYQRRDVPEECKINVATLDINVTTF